NLLLLKPARPDLAFRLDGGSAGRAAEDRGPATILAGIYELPQAADGELISLFEHSIAPKLRSDNVRVQAGFVTEPAKNTFPRLPVREGVHVLVWFGLVEHSGITARWLDRVADMSALTNIRPSLLDLAPTSRSMLGGGPLAARATKHDFDFIF